MNTVSRLGALLRPGAESTIGTVRYVDGRRAIVNTASGSMTADSGKAQYRAGTLVVVRGGAVSGIRGGEEGLPTYYV